MVAFVLSLISKLIAFLGFRKTTQITGHNVSPYVLPGIVPVKKRRKGVRYASTRPSCRRLRKLQREARKTQQWIQRRGR